MVVLGLRVLAILAQIWRNFREHFGELELAKSYPPLGPSVAAQGTLFTISPTENGAVLRLTRLEGFGGLEFSLRLKKKKEYIYIYVYRYVYVHTYIYIFLNKHWFKHFSK